jgi:hypothetical protein
MLRRLFGLDRSKSFECSYCQCTFSTKEYLDDHITKHITVKFYCVQCGIWYNFNTFEIEIHEIRCKKQKCIYCNAYYDNLNEHSQQCNLYKNMHPYNRPSDIFRSLFGPLDVTDFSQRNDVFQTLNFGSSDNDLSQRNDVFQSLNLASSGNDLFGLIFGDALTRPTRPVSSTEGQTPNIPIIPVGEDTPASNETPESDLCKICMSNIANTINLPCAHIYFCVRCSIDYVKKFNKTRCPVCKLEMTEMKRYFK